MFSCFWGKTEACSALSPPLPLCLSIFSSLPSSHPAAVFLSELESGAKLFFPLILTASQAGTYRITDINKHRLFILSFFFFCSPGSLSLGCWLCTDLILDDRLRGTLWLGCCDCVLTLLRENRLTIRRNVFMVRRLISHLSFLPYCCPYCPCDLWCIFGALVYHLAWPLVISCLTWNIQQSCFFGSHSIWRMSSCGGKTKTWN